jgi:DegV family protein with EDD domain
VPTTSTPPIGDFLAVYEAAATEASDIVSIHVSATLSSTLASAEDASALVSGARIRVVDSGTGAMGQGFAAIEAARLAGRGADVDAVAARAAEVGSKARVILYLNTLEYLRKGGRIGGAAALLGSILSIKPLVCLAGARVQAFGRARSKPRAVQRMLAYMAEVAASRPVHVAVFHADVQGEAEALRAQVAEQFGCAELYITEFTPVIGAHTGPGVLGLAFYAE